MDEGKHGLASIPLHLLEIMLNNIPQEKGDFIESFTSKHLIMDDGRVPDEALIDKIKWCSAALYAGGGDTVSLYSFSPIV